MGTLLAQSGVAEVCGPAEEAERLCEVVYDLTGNGTLARAAGVGSTAVWIVLVVLVALLATRVSRRAVARYGAQLEERTTRRLERAYERGAISDTQRFRTRRLQRLQAASGVVRGVLGVIIWTIALLFILDLLGVPLQPLLAGAGLASVVIGFGAQQLVRDVLAGIAMLVEDQYGVGDWIEVDGRFGVVERVGLRSTAFRDVDGVLHHVLNGYIQRVGNLSQEWARATLDVPLALEADVAAAKALIHQVAVDLAADQLWGQDVIGAPEVWGVQHYGPDGIRIRVVIPTKPLRNWELTRQLRERLKYAFDAAGIRMPGQLVDLGGQRTGYAVLTARAASDGQQIDRRVEVAGSGTGDPTASGSPQAAPSPHGDAAGTGDEDAAVTSGGESGDPTGPMAGAAPTPRAPAHPDETPPDATTLLRRHQGPRPRPD
ncbi:MAG: mechanosensitive ion channel [Nitriliruptoraceae bacterium]